MTSSSVSAGSAGEPSTAEVDSAEVSSAEVSSAEVSTAELVEQLRADRLWLLQQIDGGRWPELRLDLAALERELGQVLEQAQEKLNLGGNR